MTMQRMFALFSDVKDQTINVVKDAAVVVKQAAVATGAVAETGTALSAEYTAKGLHGTSVLLVKTSDATAAASKKLNNWLDKRYGGR